MGQRPNLVGQQFGDFTVLCKLYVKNEDAYWQCRCACGAMRVYTTRHLRGKRSPNTCRECYRANMHAIKMRNKARKQKPKEDTHTNKYRAYAGVTHYYKPVNGTVIESEWDTEWDEFGHGIQVPDYQR